MYVEGHVKLFKVKTLKRRKFSRKYVVIFLYIGRVRIGKVKICKLLKLELGMFSVFIICVTFLNHMVSQ